MAFSLGLKSSSGGKTDFRPLLQKIDFFNGVDDRILEEVSSSVIQRQYGINEIIVRQGEMGLGLYIILKGKVKVEDERIPGKPVKVAELGAEEFFAEMSVVDNKPRSATVTTTEVTDCLLLTRDSFMTLMRKHPELPIRVARLLADRLRDANEKIAAGPLSGQVAGQMASATTTAAVGTVPPANPNPNPGINTVAPPPPPVVETPADPNGWKGLPMPGAVKGAKESAQGTILDLFRNFYSVKAMTRFSVAVLGCPVEGLSPDVAHEIRIGEVKVLLFPSDKPVEMEIEASEPGAFTLHVLTPHDYPETKFGPVQVTPGANYRMALSPSGVSLIPPTQ